MYFWGAWEAWGYFSNKKELNIKNISSAFGRAV